LPLAPPDTIGINCGEQDSKTIEKLRKFLGKPSGVFCIQNYREIEIRQIEIGKFRNSSFKNPQTFALSTLPPEEGVGGRSICP
jgi:hypothetical protein